MVKNGTLASPAMARASRVLPVPGLPTISTPLGILPPNFWNLEGSLRKSTISPTSVFASSTPATSAKVTFTWSSLSRRARLLPKDIAPRPPAPPPCICRSIHAKTRMRSNAGASCSTNWVRKFGCLGARPMTVTFAFSSAPISAVLSVSGL